MRSESVRQGSPLLKLRRLDAERCPIGDDVLDEIHRTLSDGIEEVLSGPSLTSGGSRSSGVGKVKEILVVSLQQITLRLRIVDLSGGESKVLGKCIIMGSLASWRREECVEASRVCHLPKTDALA